MPNEESDYWFWRGLNWRAPIAWVLGVWPSLPGFAASVTPASVHVSTDWVHVYYLSWPLGFTISATVWMVLNKIWPPPGVGAVDEKDVFGTFGKAEVESREVEYGDESISTKDSKA
jgi:NCS1 family nucleobase:cation symporter-1